MRAAQVMVLIPLALFAVLVQQLLFYTGLCYAVEPTSPWRRLSLRKE